LTGKTLITLEMISPSSNTVAVTAADILTTDVTEKRSVMVTGDIKKIVREEKNECRFLWAPEAGEGISGRMCISKQILTE
jgi:hypothetical protein